MPPLIFEYDKGVSNQDEGNTPAGFVTFMQNWVYDPDDRARVFKIFGRTSSGALPGTATVNNVFGFEALQYDSGSNYAVVYTNDSLYESALFQTGTDNPLLSGGWTQILDKQASPVAFDRDGSFLKVLPSGDNRYIFFTGDPGERPLIRDEDGDWHYLGMNKPAAPSLTSIAAAASVTRASGTPATPGSTAWGTPTAGFTNTANAYDTSITTYAYATFAGQPGGSPVVKATDWKFAAASTTGVAQKLYITFGISVSSVGPQIGVNPRRPSPGGVASAVSNLYIQVSTDGGSNWTTIFSGGGNVSKTTISYDIGAAVTWTNLWVRVVFQYIGGTSSASGYVYDIVAQPATTASSAYIDAGTYYYCVTEVYQTTLDSGKTIFIESPPSDPVGVVIGASASYGIQLDFDTNTSTNARSDGYYHDPGNAHLLYRRIYRTTKSGVWPDLGYISDATIAATTFIDTFIVGSTTLGTPGINVVYAGIEALNAASPAPSFLDAVFFRGAIVAIPADDPYRIQWSLPGFPDYWPIPAQDMGLLPSIRNDKLLAVSAVGEYLVLFTRTRLLRLRDLPFVDRSNFDVARIQVDILSPNEGLAGNPLSYCLFQSQKGYSVIAWVSDNGIWMTDGSLPSEGGLGIVKLTANINWRRLVDVDSLLESRLCYDPILQMVLFDFWDVNGNRRMLGLHTSPYHWVESNQDHMVPKVSGPHTQAFQQRRITEISGVLWQLSLDSDNTLEIYTERFGVDDDGTPITSIMETGWSQPAGPQEEYRADYGSLYHSDWGPSETCNLDLLARRDDTGVIQEARKSGVPLAGASVSNFYVNRTGKSFRLRLTHTGRTTSNGQHPLRALGPTGFTGEEMDALFGV